MTCHGCSFSMVLFSCLIMAIVIVAQNKYPDICTWIQCANGGTCQSAENSTRGYQCRCQFGFTGFLCEDRVNVTVCLDNPCLNNGNCTITSDRRFQCSCLKQYTGARCEKLL